MKHLYLFAVSIALFLVSESYSQDTIFFQFNNSSVVSGPDNDTLVFDVEARGNTSNTYVTNFGIVISFSQTVFGDSAVPVYVERLELTSPTGYNLSTESESAGINSFASTFSAFYFIAPHSGALNIAFLGNLTTQYKGVVRYKMLIEGSGDAGIAFDTTNMIGQQFYVYTSGGTTGTVYDSVFFENDLLNFPITPPLPDLMFSELADPSDSNGDFIEIYNPDDQAVDFSSSAWFLTVFDGVDYDSIQLTGTLPPGGAFVIGGPNFATAYPGKTANQTAPFIESNGTDIFYLTAYHSYDYGTFVDIYNAASTPFTGKHAVRPLPLTSPNTTFTPDEWKVSPATTMDMTPGSHRITLVWDGSTSITWRDTANWTPAFVPDVGHNARIPQDLTVQPLVNSGNIANCHNFIVGETTPDHPLKVRGEKLPDKEH